MATSTAAAAAALLDGKSLWRSQSDRILNSIILYAYAYAAIYIVRIKLVLW